MNRGIVKNRVFTLPGQETLLDNIHNSDLCEIEDEKVVPCPKEGIVMVYLKYRDYREGDQ